MRQAEESRVTKRELLQTQFEKLPDAEIVDIIQRHGGSKRKWQSDSVLGLLIEVAQRKGMVEEEK